VAFSNLANDGHDTADHVHFAVVGDFLGKSGLREMMRMPPSLPGRSDLTMPMPFMSMAQKVPHTGDLLQGVDQQDVAVEDRGIIEVPLLVAQNSLSKGNW
jgi:hypothetical protein